MNKFKSIALLGFLCVGSQIGFSGEQNPMFNQPIVKGQGEAIQSNQLSQEVGLLVRYLPLESFSLKMFYEKASSKFIEKLKTIGSQFRTGSVKEIDKIVEMKNSLLAIKEEMNSFSTQCVRLTNEIKLKTVKNDGTLTENDVKDHIKAEIEQKLPGVFALIIKVKNFHPVFACESLRKIRTIADEIVRARALGIEYLNEEVVKLNEIIEGAMELSRRSAYEKFYGVPDKSGENNLAVLEVASKADLGVACKHIYSDLLETRDKLIEQNFVSGFITNPKGLVSNFLLKQRMQGQRPGPFAIEIPNNGRSTVGDTGLPFVLLATYKQPENGHFVEGVSTTNDGKPIICMMGVDGSKHTVYYDGELATYGADGEPIVRSYYLLKNGAIRELEKKLALQTIELAQLQAQYNTQKIENNKIKFAMREAMGQIDILQ